MPPNAAGQQIHCPPATSLTVMDASETSAQIVVRTHVQIDSKNTPIAAFGDLLVRGGMICKAFRKKRQQANSRDAPLNSIPTTTTSATAGGAWIKPSDPDQHIDRTHIFPSRERRLGCLDHAIAELLAIVRLHDVVARVERSLM
jgi:hypothetical protein